MYYHSELGTHELPTFINSIQTGSRVDIAFLSLCVLGVIILYFRDNHWVIKEGSIYHQDAQHDFELSYKGMLSVLYVVSASTYDAYHMHCMVHDIHVICTYYEPANNGTVLMKTLNTSQI